MDITANRIIDQQAFRHRDGKGGVLHSVALIHSLNDGYQVQVFSCPFGADGLPNFAKGGYTNPGKTFTNVRQASRFFDELVNQQRGRWTFLDREETLPFTLDSPAHTKAPVLEYVSESFVPGVIDPWGCARQHLASCFFDQAVQSFLSRLAGRITRGERRWTMPLTADFLPIVLHLAIAGVGELQRDGVPLTEGQMRTMARTVAVDPDIDALYRTLGLRDLLPDYAAAIGSTLASLVL